MKPMHLNTALKGLFENKVKRANRKAAKLGMAPVTFTYGKTYEASAGTDTIGSYLIHKNGREERVALYTEVHLDGEAPVIDGYRFVATVDLRGEKPVVKAQPYAGNVDLSKYHDTDCHCDHCGYNRNRNDVLVLQDVATGETMQLGRSCAADFFRSKDATAMLACSDWIDSYGNITDPQGRAEPRMGVERLFAMAAAVVRVFGWVNHKDLSFDDRLVSTKARVWQNLFPWATMDPADRVTVTAEDEAEAKIVMKWLHEKFLDVPTAECNDFQRNVQAVVEGVDTGYPMIREKYLNYLIWGIAGYKRDLQRDAEERRRKAEAAKQVAASEFVGVPGERGEFEGLTLTFRRVFGTQYGVKVLLKFIDPDDNVVVWWGTNDTALNMIVDEVYALKATVKGHETYEGMKQTVLTRAQVLEGKLKEDEE